MRTSPASLEHDLPVAIIGAGPAGLMAAERLAERGRKVVIYERMPSPARKFLMAGRGGLNLTHTEPLEAFLKRYRPAAPLIEDMVRAFPPEALLDWVHGLGIETFAGSSGRVFPKGLKASPLLRAWLRRLEALGVTWHLGYRWTGWDDLRRLTFMRRDGERAAAPCSAVVLALGGASWPRLGSDGTWNEILERQNISIAPFAPSNAGFHISWSDFLRHRHAGTPLKRIALSFNGTTHRGEAVITKSGLEGGAVYAMSGDVRDALASGHLVRVSLDLRPDINGDDLARRIGKSDPKQSLANTLRKAAALAPAAIALLREPGPLPKTPEALAHLIKAVPLTITGIDGLARAISSAGGIRLESVDAGLMLRSHPGVFVAGEMLDWEAPTGGYLLQACFASGVLAAEGVDRWIKETARQT